MEKPSGQMVPMTGDSVCFCRSGKPFKLCCGTLLTRRDGVAFFANRTSAPAEMFFVGNPYSGDLYTDPSGRVPIFANRAQALQLAQTVQLTDDFDPMRILGVIGTTKEKFRTKFSPLLSKLRIDYYLVPESIAGA